MGEILYAFGIGHTKNRIPEYIHSFVYVSEEEITEEDYNSIIECNLSEEDFRKFMDEKDNVFVCVKDLSTIPESEYEGVLIAILLINDKLLSFRDKFLEIVRVQYHWHQGIHGY